jgi:hypothetical protein
MKNTKVADDGLTPAIKISRSRGSGKKRPDLFARLRNDEHPLDSIIPASSETSEPIQPILSNDSPSNPIQPEKKPTAPARDFQRVPNSITRDAVPSGLFKGTSKSTYDALYLRTRGAINPVRTIKATKRELMKWIGISHVTIFKHLKHLEFIGLLKIEQQLGSHDGSIYEVFIPEEVQPIQSHTNPSNDSLSYPMTSNPNQSNAIQSNNVVPVPYNNLVLDRMGKTPENIEDNQSPKTSLKTNIKTDDESARVSGGFSVMAKRFDEAVKKLTGKGVSKNEAEKWGTLAELLILELETAAKRADSISSVPAFLTEVLRRKLMGANAANPKAQKAKPDVIGKPNKFGSYEIKPLDEAGREAALEQLQEFADDDFLRNFEKWYTPGDWTELMAELKKDGETKTDKTAE